MSLLLTCSASSDGGSDSTSRRTARHRGPHGTSPRPNLSVSARGWHDRESFLSALGRCAWRAQARSAQSVQTSPMNRYRKVSCLKNVPHQLHYLTRKHTHPPTQSGDYSHDSLDRICPFSDQNWPKHNPVQFTLLKSFNRALWVAHNWRSM